MNIRRLTLFLMLAVLCIAGAEQASAFYNPGTGRWLSRDPLQETGGANLYAMVRNNPVSFVDPLGLRELNSSEQNVIAKLQNLANEVRKDGPELAKGIEAVIADLKATIAGINHDGSDPVNLKVAEAALNIWADKDQANAYLDNPATGDYKCNLFVKRTLSTAGVNATILDYPSRTRRRWPLAGDWFDMGEKQLAKFKVVYKLTKKDHGSDGVTLAEWNQPANVAALGFGDIVSLGTSGLPTAQNSAHVGISLGAGLFISATVENLMGDQSAVGIKFIVPTFRDYDTIIYRTVPSQ